MAPPKVSTATAYAFNDVLSVVDPPLFASVAPKKHSRSVDAAVYDDGTKRHKSVSSRNVLESKAADTAGGREKNSSSSAKDKVAEGGKGKTQFYHESIRLSEDMVQGRLLGFSGLVLAPKPGDYGEMRFYAGSVSSSKLDSLKEESYHIACSLGVLSDADLACGFNFREIGLLPTGSDAVAKFSEFCSRFRAIEV